MVACTLPITPPVTQLGPYKMPFSFAARFGFRCDRDGCSKRMTPPSVLFPWQNVYLGALVIFVPKRIAAPVSVTRVSKVLSGCA